MLPDLESLRCFTEGAQHLNFRAAASAIALSPAAFSDRIRRLEEQVGHALFTRSTRRVRLTVEGERLLPQALRVLEEARRCISSTRGDRVPYELYLGTRYELGLSWLCPALRKLERAHPERTIHVYNGDSPDLLLRLERGELDTVVASMRLSSPKLTYAVIHDEDYVLVSSKPCLKSREDAINLTLVDVSRDLPLFRYLLDALPQEEPWRFGRVEYMGGIGNIRSRLLFAPKHVAVLPKYFVQRDLAARRLVRLMPDIQLRSDAFRLVWRTSHPRTSDLRGLAEELRKFPLR